MKINYDEKGNKFLIECSYDENTLVMGLPDKRFRKTSRIWAAPVLRRNIQYLDQFISNPQFYSKEALHVFNLKRAEFREQPKGDTIFPAWYTFKNDPMPHQAKALQNFFPLKAAGILFEQGLGKTFTSINLAAAWRMTNQIEAVIVICPSSIKLVWKDELDKHCPIPTQRHTLIAGKYKQVEKFIEEKTDFQWLMVGVEAFSQGSAIDYVERFAMSRRCLIIIDESSNIKTPNKIRTDRCVKLGKLAAKRLILSGTSLTQGVEDWYTQFKFMDPDIIGYDSYYSYRAQYCEIIYIETGVNPKTGQPINVPKIVGYKNLDELIKTVSPYIMRVEKKDVLLDLPDKVFTNRYVEMTPAQKKLYNDMKEELIVEINDVEYEVKTILEQMMRLQQITGGHYPWDDGEKVVTKVIPGKNPKIEELLNIMEEIPGKVIVWCQFRPEIELVAQALRNKGIQFVEFHGGKDYLEKEFAVENFRGDPNTKVFLATRAAAYGLTLIEASTAVYYSQGPSLDQYLQSQDRFHRIGQVNKCLYIHLVVERTVDVKIIKALEGKKNMADLVYSLLKEED
jgi:SNF2 family DNA or RNA helicase